MPHTWLTFWAEDQLNASSCIKFALIRVFLSIYAMLHTWVGTKIIQKNTIWVFRSFFFWVWVKVLYRKIIEVLAQRKLVILRKLFSWKTLVKLRQTTEFNGYMYVIDDFKNSSEPVFQTTELTSITSIFCI